MSEWDCRNTPAQGQVLSGFISQGVLQTSQERIGFAGSSRWRYIAFASSAASRLVALGRHHSRL